MNEDAMVVESFAESDEIPTNIGPASKRRAEENIEKADGTATGDDGVEVGVTIEEGYGEVANLDTSSSDEDDGVVVVANVNLARRTPMKALTTSRAYGRTPQTGGADTATAGAASTADQSASKPTVATTAEEDAHHDELKKLRFHKHYTAFDVDLDALEEHPWRDKNVDLLDYFNYGFNEKTWKIYSEKQLRLRAEKGFGPREIIRPTVVVNSAVVSTKADVNLFVSKETGVEALPTLPTAPTFPSSTGTGGTTSFNNNMNNSNMNSYQHGHQQQQQQARMMHPYPPSAGPNSMFPAQMMGQQQLFPQHLPMGPPMHPEHSSGSSNWSGAAGRGPSSMGDFPLPRGPRPPPQRDNFEKEREIQRERDDKERRDRHAKDSSGDPFGRERRKTAEESASTSSSKAVPSSKSTEQLDRESGSKRSRDKSPSVSSATPSSRSDRPREDKSREDKHREDKHRERSRDEERSSKRSRKSRSRSTSPKRKKEEKREEKSRPKEERSHERSRKKSRERIREDRPEKERKRDRSHEKERVRDIDKTRDKDRDRRSRSRDKDRTERSRDERRR